MNDERPLVSQRELTELEDQRHLLLSEVAELRRARDMLTEEVAAAEARHAQVAERTLEARERRQNLAGEVIALCGERAALIERISALRIAAIEMEASHHTTIPSSQRSMDAPSVRERISEPAMGAEPDTKAETETETETEAAIGTDPAPPSDIKKSVGAPLTTPGGRVAATWTARARTTVKPRNDSYESGAQMVWRRSEDRIRLSATDQGVLAAVADGAGASGLYCGAWAETLVDRLPTTPISSIDDLNLWLDGFCLEFRKTIVTQCKADPPKHSKFVREGSFATLSACWLGATEKGIAAHWLGYGDSPLLIFDRTGNEVDLILAHPASLAAFDRDPHLLNWTVMPEALRLSAGKVMLPARATVVLATDGIGQYLMLRYLAAARKPARAPVGVGLAEEFRRLSQSAEGRLATAVKAHAARPSSGAPEMLAATWQDLASDGTFAALVATQCDNGLLANDDSSLIIIEIEPSCA